MSQPRQKWNVVRRNVAVDDVVLLVDKGEDIFNGVYPPGAFFPDVSQIFRPLKILLRNFGPLDFSGKNFRPLKTVLDPLNFMAQILTP